jgi:hypothetical protein
MQNLFALGNESLEEDNEHEDDVDDGFYDNLSGEDNEAESVHQPKIGHTSEKWAKGKASGINQKLASGQPLIKNPAIPRPVPYGID